MIWIDLVTPKSILFFKPIIEELKRRNRKLLITTREGEDYTEVIELLKLHKIKHISIGEFGGKSLKNKLTACFKRQAKLMDLVCTLDIDRLVSLCSVDANRVAFGLKIPVINFYDIPLSDCKTNFKKALPQARLTLPLSTKVLKPFVVPDEIFLRFSLEAEQIYTYDFIDPIIWLISFKPQKKYFEKFLASHNIDRSKKLIVVREEEYKSSYVNRKYPFLYEAIPEFHHKLKASIVIIPRYESKPLKKEFPYATVLEEKIAIQHLLAFCHVFIGGGGTLNTEACYFGTPTISTRSFVSHYDKYQIEEGLMATAESKDEIIKKVSDILNNPPLKKTNTFQKMEVDITSIVDQITT